MADPAKALIARLEAEGRSPEEIVVELVAAAARSEKVKPKGGKTKRVRKLEALKIVRDMLDDQIRRWGG